MVFAPSSFAIRIATSPGAAPVETTIFGRSLKITLR